MAFDITPGTGKTIAADVHSSAHAPASGEQMQYIKFDIGVAGSSAPVVGGQLAMAASIPVTLASDDPLTVATGGKTNAPATTFDTTSWSVIALLKGIGGFLSTLAGAVSGGKLKSTISGSSFLNLTAAGTSNAIKSGAGTLKRIVIGSQATVAGSLVLYDALTATGTIITTLNTLVSLPGSIEVNAAFSTGLTAVMSTSGTSANVTLVYE